MAVGPDDFDFVEDWSIQEWRIYDDLLSGEPETMADRHLADLFHEAMFDKYGDNEERTRAYDELVDYLDREYGIDFENDFDWEDYRAWYDAA